MSSISNCDVCGKEASSVCDRCKKNFCGKKHLKSHKRSCFPSTEGLTTKEVARIEKLAINLKDASLQTFCETLDEVLKWDVDEQRKPQGFHSVFLRAEGAPAFVRALERHHAQQCVDGFDVIVALDVMANSNVDVLSSIVEADVCKIVVQCNRVYPYQLDDELDLRYRQLISTMFHSWLLLMPGSTALRKELIKSGAIKIIIQWLEDWGVNVSAETFLVNRVAKKAAFTFLHEFIRHNFACKTMLVEIGGIRAIAAVIRENWGDAVIRLECKNFLEKLYCRCRDCTESKFCNLCGSKAKFACPCSMVRYCSKECQRKDWKSHKTLCGTRPITGREDNTFDECEALKATGTIDPDDVSRSGIDVVERLRSALSINDVMRWLLVLARVPYEEMLRSDGFAAVVHVMIKYEDVAEIQRRGCAFFLIFNIQEGASPIDVITAVTKAGGSRAILNAMKKHPYDNKLQGSACNVLIGLVTLRKADNRCDVHVPATHAVIGAMLRHKDDFGVQEGGCGALCNLVASGHPDNKKELLMAGGVHVVAAASETFWGGSVVIDDRVSGIFTTLFEVGNA